MTNEPEDKPSGGEDHDDESDDGEQDRPTVAPPFDPVAFAQEVLGGKPSPAAGTPAVKANQGAPAGPLSDPLSAPAGTPSGRKTPQGLLSLANARIPSNLPPRKESTNSFAAVDKEWEELATSPPPPMQQDLIDAMSRSDSRDSPDPGYAPDEPPSTKDAQDLAAAVAASASAARSVAPVPPAPPPPPTAQEMNDRVSLGDYTGALEIAEKLLEVDPNDEAVKVVAESCRGILKQMYTTRIGPLDRVPLVMVARDQLRWLSIDHRAGFVLSLVDGVSSLEMILDVSGMPELDALRILSELAQQRIISFR